MAKAKEFRGLSGTPEYLEEANVFLQLIKNVPCGKVSRGSKNTLYQAIASLKRKNSQETISSEDIKRISFVIVSFIPQIKYGNELLEAYKEATSKGELGQGDFFTAFLIMLAGQQPELLHQICRSVDRGWQKIIIEALQIEEKRQDLHHHHDRYRLRLQEEIKKELGAGPQWTNVPKAGLNAATARICELFCKLTGQPQYGLVGQLLYHANLEDARSIKEKKDRYRVLSKRVAERMRRLGTT